MAIDKELPSSFQVTTKVRIQASRLKRSEIKVEVLVVLQDFASHAFLGTLQQDTKTSFYCFHLAVLIYEQA